jgi:hypothetical protein
VNHLKHADTERDAIRLALTTGYRPVYQAGRELAEAYTGATTKSDLFDALGHAVHLIKALSNLQAVAAAAEKTARAELLRVMEDTGCPNIACGDLTAYLAKKPSFVDIAPDTTLDPQFMTYHPPTPDRSMLRKALEDGGEIPGVRLVIPNEQTLTIRSRSRTQ